MPIREIRALTSIHPSRREWALITSENDEYYSVKQGNGRTAAWVKVPNWPGFYQIKTTDLTEEDLSSTDSAVNHPKHYNANGKAECIDIIETMSFNIGNAVKYLWRAGLKGDLIEDLEKAAWYINREISRLREKT